MNNKANKLIKKLDYFISLADKNIAMYPWLVVILMHEYYRNLYPVDPYVPFQNKSHLQRISLILDRNIEILEKSSYLGSYFFHIKHVMETTVGKFKTHARLEEGQTQKVYGALWDKFNVDIYKKEARRIIVERFKNAGLDLKGLKNKIILDLGCGSGRFTIALAFMTGARKVYGLDLGAESIRKAEEVAKKIKVTNVIFELGDVLKNPFKEDYFDFIFCNGVLHHTKNMEKGIQEMFRVLKPGARAFLYLYADGGLFWYSRKKMPQVIRKIPQEYTMAVLDLIGMPKNRFIFVDNWYVPIERHTTRHYLEGYLKKIGFCDINKIIGRRLTDLDFAVSNSGSDSEILWGEGEHRYLLRKPGKFQL